MSVKYTIDELAAPKSHLEAFSLELPAGTYFVGDPCYVIKDSDVWADFCEKYDEYSEKYVSTVGGAVINNHPMVATGTAYGDGLYMDDDGREYSVDAGLIGLTPVELLKSLPDFEEAYEKGSDLGHWIDFESPVSLSYKEGVVTIESDEQMIVIDTAD